MCYKKKTKQLYFLHVPKCGGTFVRNFISGANIFPNIYAHQVYCNILHYDPNLDHLKKSNLITGHLANTLISALSSYSHTVTVYRDPVARSISLLHHLKQESENMISGNLYGSLRYSHFVSDACLSEIARIENIEEIIEIEEVRGVVSNLFLRHLGTSINIESILKKKHNLYVLDEDKEFQCEPIDQLIQNSKSLIMAGKINVLGLNNIKRDIILMLYKIRGLSYSHLSLASYLLKSLNNPFKLRPMSMTPGNYRASDNLVKTLKKLNSGDYELAEWLVSNNYI